MNTELKVAFYLKRERKEEKTSASENPVYPITGKIIIGKTIAQFSTKLKVEERLWHVKSGRVAGKSHAAIRLNREINKMNLSIHTHYKDILKRTGKVTALDVKNAFQGIAATQKTLLVLFEEIMQDFHARIGIDRAKSTYIQHEILYKQIKHFLRTKYNVADIPLTELDLPFIEALDFYFRVNRRMKPRTVKARIVLLNKIVRLALHRNIITRPPFEGFELVKAEVKNRSLTAEELDRLITTPLRFSTQSFIRDMFVFSTFTGISYADLKKLSWKDIITEDDGSRWISTDRQKTKTTFNVKLLNIPVQIMERYKGLAIDNRVFPPMSLGRVNVGLKRVAKKCGINSALSFHVARYTFASQICLSQGVPIESVSRMMGHKNIHTTQRYARLNNEKIGNDMKELSLRLTGKFSYSE
ncbi:MAG: Tyrosine recombinase XerC [Candidatus Ordinivivax streblomastigis]|uniref:Tyrosine recombinase XerC n=1 Tax=Candidatus Ordinivivax streblomastigis TaxID=2540710 RepID=A0A5M8NWS3_9BACT|nr:MAG: Tyrosine recombinase XerC [Candidatus Ordinivivax streblomastigis]